MFQIRVARPNEDVIFQWWIPEGMKFDWPFRIGDEGQLWKTGDPMGLFVQPPYKIEVGEWPEPKSFWQRTWAWIARRKAKC